MRIGQGYDVHRLVGERRLILGGVEIPYEKGLLGHSDADVLVHAVMDALLGAAALGDIGQHFPDTDPAYKGISSIELLRRVGELLDEKGYVIERISMPPLLPRSQSLHRTGRRWRPIWQRPSTWMRAGSASRPPRRRGLALQEQGKGFLLRQLPY